MDIFEKKKKYRLFEADTDTKKRPIDNTRIKKSKYRCRFSIGFALKFNIGIGSNFGIGTSLIQNRSIIYLR